MLKTQNTGAELTQGMLATQNEKTVDTQDQILDAAQSQEKFEQELTAYIESPDEDIVSVDLNGEELKVSYSTSGQDSDIKKRIPIQNAETRIEVWNVNDLKKMGDTDYNRDTIKSSIKVLKKSIKKTGYRYTQPILIIEFIQNGEIICTVGDGKNRKAAIDELHKEGYLDIEFSVMIISVTTIDEVRSIIKQHNSDQVKWSKNEEMDRLANNEFVDSFKSEIETYSEQEIIVENKLGTKKEVLSLKKELSAPTLKRILSLPKNYLEDDYEITEKKLGLMKAFILVYHSTMMKLDKQPIHLFDLTKAQFFKDLKEIFEDENTTIDYLEKLQSCDTNESVYDLIKSYS